MLLRMTNMKDADMDTVAVLIFPMAWAVTMDSSMGPVISHLRCSMGLCLEVP